MSHHRVMVKLSPLVELATAAQGPAESPRFMAHVVIDPPAAVLAPIWLLSPALVQIDADATAKNTRVAQQAVQSKLRGLYSPGGSACILSSRCKHFAQVTSAAGGSAHPELLPGSTEHSAMRQCGLTAWNIG